MKVNPLRDLLAKQVDFEGLRARPDVKLFVTASNVRTCKSRLFRTPELTAETLMASACLPFLFEAVEIDGEFYWDGGYLGNPAIYPLIHECSSSDVVIVQINPLTAQRGADDLARHPQPHQRDDLQRQPGARDGGHRHHHEPGGDRQAERRPLHRGAVPPDQRRDRAREDGRAQQDEHRALVPRSTCTASATRPRTAGSGTISSASAGKARSTCWTSISSAIAGVAGFSAPCARQRGRRPASVCSGPHGGRTPCASSTCRIEAVSAADDRARRLGARSCARSPRWSRRRWNRTPKRR